MSDKLYRLGWSAYKRRWFVLISWLVLLVTMGVLMAVFQKPADTSFSIPGTESQVALDKLAKSFPQASGASGRIVFAAPEGAKISDYSTVINRTMQDLRHIEGVALVAGPAQTGAVSADGRVGLVQVQLSVGMGEVTEGLADSIAHTLDGARSDGLQAEVGGDLSLQQPGKILGVGEIVGVGVAAITLAITFGALFAAGLPLITAFIGVAIGVAGVFASSAFLSINATTPTLAVMLGLAVGIDYALFIVTRHRKYLMEGLPLQKAAARAISTAGNAVIFAALTVVIALAALSVTGIPFVAIMGFAAAATVAVAALVAITLIPALLGFAGEKVLSKKQRTLLAQHKVEETPAEIKRSLAHRWATLVTARPLVPIVLGVVVLVAIALPLKSLELGFPGDNTAPLDSTQRKAYTLVSESFGPGFSGPLIAVVSLPTGLSAADAQGRLGAIATNFMKVDGVAMAAPAGIDADGQTALLQIVPTTGPSDPATKILVDTLRRQSAELVGSDASLALTGSAALLIDVSEKLDSALLPYLLVVIGLSILLLILVFRSILIPVKATLGFLLTIAATFGALVALFQWGWFGLFEPTTVVSFLPIIVIGIVFGLAMDYEFFLVSSMRESYVHDFPNKPKKAVVEGFVYGSRVVTAAAIIMIAVFSGFITNHEQMIQMIGFALAFGVFVDAFIVRMTIVPAVMALVGRRAWWLPAWLDSVLPNVSIEGQRQPSEAPVSSKRKRVSKK